MFMQVWSQSGRAAGDEINTILSKLVTRTISVIVKKSVSVFMFVRACEEERSQS